MQLGSKRAGTNCCRNDIGNGIRLRYIAGVGTEPIHRNIMRYLRWFYNNSSEKEWLGAVGKYYVPYQYMFSAKHLLPTPTTSNNISKRYGNKSVLNGIDHLIQERIDDNDECEDQKETNKNDD